jgi:hypothetical protein
MASVTPEDIKYLVSGQSQDNRSNVSLGKLKGDQWTMTEQKVAPIVLRLLGHLTDKQQEDEKELPIIGSQTYNVFVEKLTILVKKEKSSQFISQLYKILKSTPKDKSILGDNQVLETKLSNDVVEEKNTKKKGKGKGKKKKEKKNKLSKKALAIIAKNSAEKLNSRFQEVVRCLSIRNKDILLKPLPNEPVEFRLLRLLLSSQFIEPYEWLMLCFKTIKKAYQFNGLALLAIYHIEEMVKFVSHTCRFSFKKLDENSPHLIVSNKSMLDSLNNIKLREFQQQLKSIPLFDKPKLVLLHAMIGYGKTVSGVAYANMVHKRAMSQFSGIMSGNEDIVQSQLLFVCAVETVQLQFAKLCYNANIGPTFATWDPKTSKPTIRSSWHCSKVTGRKNNKTTTVIKSVIICDLLSALYLLLEKSKKELDETVVFLDEPTVSADQEDSLLTLLVTSIIYNTSPYLVLSSATLPRQNEISPVIEHFKSKYPDGDVVSISAMKSQIGCQLVTFDGTLIAPHTTCKTKEDVNRLITRLNTEPFVRRLYSPRMVFRLEETMRKSNVKDVFDVDKDFLENPTSLSHHSFVECVVKLLQRLLEEDDEVIEKVCSNATLQNNQEESDISIPLYLTQQIHRFDKPTLITSTNPVSIAKEMLNGLIDNTTDLETKLELSKKEYEANLTKQKRDLSNLENRKDIKSRDHRRMEEQKILNREILPDISFLHRIIPYSKSWANTFDLKHNNQERLRYGCDFTDVAEELGVQDWLLLLLFAGVGVYGDVPELSQSYKTLVSNLASNGRLRFVISDDTIIYGTDWPIGIVVCLDDIADKHSVASLMQLFGRAGRVGKCYTAFAYASNRVHERIVGFIMGKESTGTAIEGKNICIAFNQYNDFRNKMIKKKKEDEEQRKILAEERKKQEELRKKREALRKKLEEEDRKKKVRYVSPAVNNSKWKSVSNNRSNYRNNRNNYGNNRNNYGNNRNNYGNNRNNYGNNRNNYGNNRNNYRNNRSNYGNQIEKVNLLDYASKETKELIKPKVVKTVPSNTNKWTRTNRSNDRPSIRRNDRPSNRPNDRQSNRPNNRSNNKQSRWNRKKSSPSKSNNKPPTNNRYSFLDESE